MMTNIDRDQARAIFDSAGLTYNALTLANVQLLRMHINKQMIASGLIRGTYRCMQRATFEHTPHGLYAQVRCRAFYFKGREAVSFNPDGFIGFAGWADENNIQPVLAGFVDWCCKSRLRGLHEEGERGDESFL